VKVEVAEVGVAANTELEVAKRATNTEEEEEQAERTKEEEEEEEEVAVRQEKSS
jgi:hypothetical protein